MTNLKETFPDIYTEFFSKCTRVASAPHSFFWFGELSGFWGGPTLLQKLPYKFYVGLEPIEKKSFEINPVFYAYDRNEGIFKKHYFDEYIIERLKTLDLKGWRINFLSEITIGVSLGAVGAMSASLAKLLHDTDDINLLFEKAWEISRTLQSGNSSGATVYTALAESAYPIVFSSSYPSYTAKPLDTLFKLDGPPMFPIDFGLIFSGNTVKGETVIKSIQAAKKVFEQDNESLTEFFDKKAITPETDWNHYLGMLNTVTKQGIVVLKELFEKGHQDHIIEHFFTLINQYQNLLHFISLSTNHIDEIYTNIHHIANKTQNHTGSGVKITGIGKGGEVLFAFPFSSHRASLEEWLGNTDYVLDYASWKDGLYDKGVVIEQDIPKNIQSGFLSSNKVKIDCWDRDKFSTVLTDYINIDSAKYDLVLDTLKNKVYINGKPITSTTLPSQRATVLIMAKLLKAKGWQLTNNKMPVETYANSRYDLQGKVVIPFLKALQDKSSQFDLKIAGGQYDDYTLTLAFNGLKTALVSRI